MPDHATIYAKHADQYDRLVSKQPPLAELLERIRPFAGLDTVDLGAGTGRLAALLAPKARSVVALDASRAMLDRAAAKLAQTGAAAWRTEEADHRSLPLADRSADLVVSGWSICYLANTSVTGWARNLRQIIGEIKRVLRPGGTVIILETLGTGTETPDAPAFLRGYYAALTEEYGFSHKWIRIDYEFEHIEQAVQLAGFFSDPTWRSG